MSAPETAATVTEKIRVTNKVRVKEAVYHRASIGLTNTNVENLSQTTGLTRQQVTDAIKDLMLEGSVGTPMKGSGIYIPLESQLPSEAVTLTRFPCGGGGKIEKGDMVMECTPNELALLAMMLAGHAANEAVMEYITQIAALTGKVQKVEFELKAYKHLLKSDPNQLKLEV